MFKKLIGTAVGASIAGSVIASPMLGNIVLNHAQDNFFNGVMAIDAIPGKLHEKRLKVKLGSITDFYRHDVEYNSQVSSLRFNMLENAAGKPIIRVKSVRPIVSGSLPLVVKHYAGREKIYGVYYLEMRPGYQGFAKNQVEHSNIQLASRSYSTSDKKSSSIRKSVSETTSYSTSGKQLSQNTHYKKPQPASIKKVAQSNYKKPEVNVKKDVQSQKAEQPKKLITTRVGVKKSTALSKPELPAATAKKPIIATSMPKAKKVPVVKVKPIEKKPIPKNVKQSIASQQAVIPGSSISKIAMELLPHYPEYKNWKALMNQLVKMNPYAFVDGDKNRLRENAVLNLPETKTEKATQKKSIAKATDISPSVKKQVAAKTAIMPTTKAEKVSEKPKPVKPKTAKAKEKENVASKKSEGSLTTQNKMLSGTSISKIAIELMPKYPEYKNWKILMGELVRLNPDAFIKGDKKRLKASAILKLPETSYGTVVQEKMIVRGDGVSEINKADNAAEKKAIAQASRAKSLNAQATPIPKEPAVKEVTISTEPAQPVAIAEKPSVLNTASAGDENLSYTVGKNESISSIAVKLLERFTEYGHWQNLMSHLVALNPNVFVNGDIDLLQVGSRLRLPTRERRLKALVRLDEISDALSGKLPNNRYKVALGDSFSTIAVRLARETGGSAREVMKKLVELNPHAYSNNNIDNLWAGEILALPEGSQGQKSFVSKDKKTESLPEQLGVSTNRVPTHVPVTQPISKNLITKASSNYYSVAYGDSASIIAIKLVKEYPEAGGWKAILKQLVSMNPEAFVNGDPDKLLTGSVLALPTGDDGKAEVETEMMEIPVETPKPTQLKDNEAERSIKKVLTPPVQKSSSIYNNGKKYRITEGDNLSLISYKLLDKYPNISSLRVMADELIRLNPKVLSEDNLGALQVGAVLILPDPKDKVYGRKVAMHQLESGVSGRKNISSISSENTFTQYNKTSKSLERRAVSREEVASEALYIVPKGYTISMVAIRLHRDYPQYESWPELMNDLYELNPEAFVNNDINRLRNNAELKLPGSTVSVY